MARDVQHCGEEYSGRWDGDVCTLGACRGYRVFGRADCGGDGGECRQRCASDGTACRYGLSGSDIYWDLSGEEGVSADDSEDYKK